MKCRLIRKQAPLNIITLSTFILLLSTSVYSQVGTRFPTSVLDGHSVNRDHVRVDDVLWMKTVWQRIDLREKMNHRMYFTERPSQHRSALFDYLTTALLPDGGLTAYSPGLLGDNDMFDDPLNAEELKKLLTSYDTIPTPSIFEEGVIDTVIVPRTIEARNIIAYDLKEVWYIDSERSTMEVEIIGICPVMAVTDLETGEFRGTRRLFWIYYPEVKDYMASWVAYDPRNDLEYISFDRLFEERRFTAHIVKVSNVYDRYIAEYQPPLEALIEGEHLKEEIRNLEMDMWNY